MSESFNPDGRAKGGGGGWGRGGGGIALSIGWSENVFT